MIEKLWFGHHPLRWLLLPVFWPLSCLYAWISQRRKKRYEEDETRRYRASVPVVVVGNITAGGNGKTPVVIWLVETLKQRGFHPGVISRGYGGHSKVYPLEVDDAISVNLCGDEPKLIFQRTSAPVVVAPKRADAAKVLLEKHCDVDVIIADDGLQHYALERDIEFVVVDGKRRFGNGHLIPMGPLRESVDRLASVDFVINNGGNTRNSEIEMSLEPGLAVNLLTGEQKSIMQLGALVAFAGIGHPPRFFKTLTSLGAELIQTQAFSDHQAFSESELNELARRGENLIMTEKDAVKCRSFAKKNWWYLPVTAHFSTDAQEQIVQKIEEVIRYYGS